MASLLKVPERSAEYQRTELGSGSGERHAVKAVEVAHAMLGIGSAQEKAVVFGIAATAAERGIASAENDMARTLSMGAMVVVMVAPESGVCIAHNPPSRPLFVEVHIAARAAFGYGSTMYYGTAEVVKSEDTSDRAVLAHSRAGAYIVALPYHQ